MLVHLAYTRCPRNACGGVAKQGDNLFPMNPADPFDSVAVEQALECILQARETLRQSPLTPGHLSLLVLLIEAGHESVVITADALTQAQHEGMLNRKQFRREDLDAFRQLLRDKLTEIAQAVYEDASPGRSLVGRLRKALVGFYEEYEQTLPDGTEYKTIYLPLPGDDDRHPDYPYLPRVHTVVAGTGRSRQRESAANKNAAESIVLLYDVLDKPLVSAFERLLASCLQRETTYLRPIQIAGQAGRPDQPVIIVVTMNLLSQPGSVFVMGRLAAQPRPFQIALVDEDVTEAEVAAFEGFEVRGIGAPDRLEGTIRDIGRYLGVERQANSQAAISEFVDFCRRERSSSRRQDMKDLLLLPRKILEHASNEPLAAGLLARTARELYRGRFTLYRPDFIYEHDAEALRQLQAGDCYFATHPTYANPKASRSATYNRYIREQCIAAQERGVRVTRIYVDSGGGLFDNEALIEEMRLLSESNVRVRLASMDQLDERYHDDFVLIGRRMLGLGWPPRGPLQYSSYEIGEQDQVARYLEYFKSLDMASTGFLAPPGRFVTPAYHEVSDVRIDRSSARRLMVVLRTNGCEYDREKTGCKMCDFRSHAVDPAVHQVTEADLFEQLTSVVNDSLPGQIQQVDLLTLGNFLNVQEVPEAFQTGALRYLSQIGSVKKVVIESRCNYVTGQNLRQLRNELRPDQILELGVGVESSNRYIRNNVLNKALTWPMLRRTMLMARDANVSFMAYLLIKPQTLNEREAIEDAVSSARDVVDLARDCGVPLRIAFEPVFVTRNTDLENQFVHFKTYEILHLRSVIEVLKRTEREVLGNGDQNVSVFVGLSDENLSNNRKPRGCNHCTSTLTAAIRAYNASNSCTEFLNLPDCCSNEWARKLEMPAGPVDSEQR